MEHPYMSECMFTLYVNYKLRVRSLGTCAACASLLLYKIYKTARHIIPAALQKYKDPLKALNIEFINP